MARFLRCSVGRFAALYSGVKLEVQIGVSAELIEQLNAGRLDLVFAKRPLGTSKGRLVWREPLAGPRPTRSISFPAQRCRWRRIASGRSHARQALAAPRDGELTWETVYTSPSLTGVRAAALAGLAITPLPASAVIAGLRILDPEVGLPRLPDLGFAIYEKARPDKAAAALAAALLALARGPSRPTI